MTQSQIRRATARVAGLFALTLLGGAWAQAQEPEAPGAPGATAPGAPGAAAPGEGGGRRGGGARGGQRGQMPAITAFKATSPTVEQQTKFDALQTKMRDEMMALRNGTPGEGMSKIRELNEKFQTDVLALLTPAQQKTYKLELAKAQGDLNGQLESLELTRDQEKQIRPLVRDAQEELRKLRQDNTLTPETRPAKVETILKDLKGKVRPLLTPEQQTKLDAMELKAAPARGGRGGFGGGRAGGGQPGGPGAGGAPAAPER